MHDPECDCGGIPEGAVVLRELRIVEFLNPEDGEIYKIDLSHDGSDNELPLGGMLELAEWAKSMAISPLIADLVYQFMNIEEE
ncbi:hypothetical protein LITTLEE_177 [Mycobacterium phage LittleE]|uniref:Uncharacterized protein n=1 Tax=Mycobacterium phage LittleE TaxID=2922212 RepID=G1D462_9CAUD|nr:hypothetical protein FGG27_gp177 [Mycobacterium phage LittleE]AEK09556.1 hypothetical protein LITTLEE_177 [Mycobacterium phage LittleE]QBI99793.1 hypothetical protein SEA_THREERNGTARJAY_166 [Mycobacterium phage ThreeRngTarjay]